MRVLWVSNILFPEVCCKLGIPVPVVGGWMQSGAYSLLAQSADIDIAVVSIYNVSEIKKVKTEKLLHYLLPLGADDQYYDEKKEEYFEKIIDEYNPDLVHIHGSEFPHSLSCAKACEHRHTPFLVSIQGLVSQCWKYLNGGLSEDELNDILPQKTIIKERIKKCLGRPARRTPKEEMYIRGEYERQLLKMSNNVVGRTSWDKSHVCAVNPQIKYYLCNETLREEFYDVQWDYSNCDKHTIFLSQGNYPLKGLHVLLDAIVYVKQQFPDVILYIGGSNIINDSSYQRNGYARFIKNKLVELNIDKNIHFLGYLNASQMKDRYLRANVYVNCSFIENSPNSVGEAQLIGTPCIGSFVGGTMDMIKHGKTGFLYRVEEVEMLAFYICKLFTSPEICKIMSDEERQVALLRLNGEVNAHTLLNIYDDIKNNTCKNN